MAWVGQSDEAIARDIERVWRDEVPAAKESAGRPASNTGGTRISRRDGYTADSILARLKRDNPDLAGRVWRDEVPVSRKHGANQHTEQSGHGATRSTTSEGLTADSILARLKRDNPDLAERVINGEITANAAARIMG